MENFERIGKVVLDYDKYPGEDFYCDGAVEDEILGLVKNLSQVEYQEAIESRKSWPVLYHLSPLRENIVDWIPMDKSSKVLEVGSGCGAITGALARKAGSVTCVDLSKKRSMINAYRHAECDNVTIHVGNFKDIEPDLDNDFDYICLIGVFEYAGSYIGGDTPFHDFLRILMPHLAENGRIVIAIENQYGLKYFAGCKEDHLGSYYTGIEDYPAKSGVRTYGRKRLERIFTDCGINAYEFYYPYPDYKFMTTLFSDRRLPGKGELSNNLRNFDRDRMQLFDEKSAYDGIIEEEAFPFFSNSYLAVLGQAFPVDYVKYSNDRAPEYSIRTQIEYDQEGQRVVRKYPCTLDAVGHIQGMEAAYQGLCDRYAQSQLSINKCELIDTEEGPCAQFEFVEGIPLTEKLDSCLQKGDTEGFYALFDSYLDKIGFNPEYPVSDFDPIFSNILVSEDRWTLIDYEWTFGKEIELKELAFRAVYCYILENEARNSLQLDKLLEKLEITAKDAEDYRAEEADFQSFVTGKHFSMSQMRDLIGYRVLKPVKWVEREKDSEEVNRVQIYEDRGEGYKEEESYFVPDAYQGEHQVELELSVDGNVRMLRIDPAFDSCLVTVEELTFNGVPVDITARKQLLINGRFAKPATLIFATKDPNINLDLTLLERQGENKVNCRMTVYRIPETMAEQLSNNVKKIF